MSEARERVGVEAYFGIDDFVRNTAMYVSILQDMQQRTSTYAAQVKQATAGASTGWEVSTKKSAAVIYKQTQEIDRLRGVVTNWSNRLVTDTTTASGAWSKFTTSVIGQVATFRSTLMQMQILTQSFMKPFQQFIAMGREGVGMQRMRINLTRMVGGVEEYNKTMEKMREVTMGTMKDSEMTAQAFKIMSLGLADTADRAAEVARNVTLLARAAGQVPSPQAAMQVFSLMMSNQSRMRLDAFGLSIGETDARIEHLKNTLGLTAEEAFREAIFQLMNERVEALGLNVETAITKLDRMNAQLGNMGDQLKTMVTPEFGDFADVVAAMTGIVITDISSIEEAWVKFVARVRASTVAYLGPAFKGMAAMFGGIKAMLTGEDTTKYYDLLNEAAEDWKNRTEVYNKYAAEVIESHYAQSAVDAEDSSQSQLESIQSALNEAESAYEGLQSTVDEAYAKMEASARDKMNEIVRDTTYKVIDMQREMSEERIKDQQEMADRLVEIEQQLQNDLQTAQANYSTEVAAAHQEHSNRLYDIERDYLKRVADINRDYANSLWQAVSERNATEALLAKRKRDESLGEAKEEREEQVGEANRQYAERLSAARQALLQEQEEARKAYAEQKRELENSLREKERERQKSYQDQLEDLERSNARRRGEILNAWGMELSDQYIAHGAELAAARTHYNQMLVELSTYLANRRALLSGYSTTSTTGGVIGGRQGGGYVNQTGQYTMHQGEFVLAPSTTQQMEQLLGGMLTQQKMMSSASRQMSAVGPQRVDHVVSGDVRTGVEAVVTARTGDRNGAVQAAVAETLRRIYR